MRFLTLTASSVLIMATAASAQTGQDYMQKVMVAAPPEVVNGATIVQMDGKEMKTVRRGENGWTCMAIGAGGGTPMCADASAMEWAHALMTNGPAPNTTGFIYMLGGDQGASNTDPKATVKTADNHWVVTGPHVMIVGPTVKDMQGYPRTADPDVTKPYVMWPGTPYEHLMLPVGTTAK
jgi:hypothetical protein